MEHERIQPSIFAGPATWHSMKCYVANYTPTERNKVLYKQWLLLQLELFPCEKCSRHAMRSWKKHNVDNYLQNKDRLYLYISRVLQAGANKHKGVENPLYYESKKFIFQSMNGHCEKCS